MPLVCRDDIKEILFNTLGWQDREWSKRLGRASYELLYYVAEVQLQTRQSFILEFNFDAKAATPRFLALKEKYAYKALQIVCHAEDAVLMQRFRTRAESGERHPGNVDHTIYQEFAARLAEGAYQPLAIDGPVIEVDTSDFVRMDYDALLLEIKKKFRPTYH